jgi:hypothetical protein
MSYATDTINTFNYLFEKYDKVLKEEMARCPTKLIRITEDKPYRKAMTNEEHDRLYQMIHSEYKSNNAWCKETGWSPAVISDIRKKKHPRYDPVRSEAWSKEAE